MAHRPGRILALMLTLAGASGAAAQAPKFLVATLEDSTILAETIDSVDWEGLARIHLAPMDLDQPDTAVLRRGYNEIGHASYIPFRAPLPTGYPRAYYLLVTDSGVSPIQVSELRGEVGYDVDPPTYRLSGRRVAYGNAAFHRPARVGGKEEFIVWSTS